MTNAIAHTSKISTNVAVADGTIILPKINCLGKFEMTAITPAAISGFQPTTVMFEGKKYDGVKVYTKTGYFKVPISLVQFAQMSNAIVAPEALLVIPEYVQTVKQLASGAK